MIVSAEVRTVGLRRWSSFSGRSAGRQGAQQRSGAAWEKQLLAACQAGREFRRRVRHIPVGERLSAEGRRAPAEEPFVLNREVRGLWPRPVCCRTGPFVFFFEGVLQNARSCKIQVLCLNIQVGREKRGQDRGKCRRIKQQLQKFIIYLKIIFRYSMTYREQ